MKSAEDIPLNLYSRHIKRRYGGRIQKIPVDAGFTCPNRDGSKGFGGCTFCNNESFSPSNSKIRLSKQIDDGINFYSRRYRDLKGFVVYFQSYSNTYAPIEQLESIYSEALKNKKIQGLVIGTRPDCVSADILDLLEKIASNYDVTIEYGLESPYDRTLTSVNRGHDFKAFEEAIDLTINRGIKICTHLIMGLPGETTEQMISTADIISRYPIDYLKIHQLHIVKDTVLGHAYKKAPFPTLSKEQYMEILMSFLIRLNPSIVIQRLFGQAPKDILLSPYWPESIGQLNQELFARMKRDGLYQGMNFEVNTKKP